MTNTQNQLLTILPPRIRSRISKELFPVLLEIRLRLGRPVQLICMDGVHRLDLDAAQEDLQFSVNTACKYSPWSAASAKEGFLTAAGGHRIGLCGEWNSNGIRILTGLCIRVSRDISGISTGIPLRDSLLILGPPGSGKTTLLRDLIRRLSQEGKGAVAVVDERCELFPVAGGNFTFDPGPHTDVLSGSSKTMGIPMVLRSMGPRWIVVDEITAAEDCDALIQAGWCGVRLLATAHASGISDLTSRPVYAPLVKTRLFQTAVVLRPDKSWHIERM